MGQLDNSCVRISGHLWRELRQLLVDPHSCGITATHHLLLERCPIDMLLYADDLESLATTRRGRIAIVLRHGNGVFQQAFAGPLYACFRYPGLSGSHNDTHHAESPVYLAGR